MTATMVEGLRLKVRISAFGSTSTGISFASRAATI
jgi:hypothetical protein